MSGLTLWRQIWDGAVGRFLSRRLKEIWGVFWLGGAFFVLLSLLSYDPLDASLNTASSGTFHNLLSVPGATVADLLLQTFGFGAYVFPAWMGITGIRAIRHIRCRKRWMRLILGGVALLLGTAALAALRTPDFWPGVAGSGGALGWMLRRFSLDQGRAFALAPDILNLWMPLGVGILSFLAVLGSFAIHPRVYWRSARHLMARVGGFFRVISGGIAGAGRVASGMRLPRFGGDGAAQKASGEEDLEMQEGRRAPTLSMPGGREKGPRLTIPTPPSDDAYQGSSRGFSRALQAEQDLPLADGVVDVPMRLKKTPAPLKSSGAVLDLVASAEKTLPPVGLLKEPPRIQGQVVSADALKASAQLLEAVLEDFGVNGKIEHIRPGPVVTLYELKPAPGIKSSRVVGLADDIARSMSAISARVAVVPGYNAIGIELPNQVREVVYLRQILESPDYQHSSMALALVLGKDIGGTPVLADLARMPHLLVAGTTGSGKSVAINVMILSLLFRMTPEQCRFIMIDPKMLELSVYNGIPHLLTPVVTAPKKAIMALRWAVREMESRYQEMSKLGVRNIDGYNARVRQAMGRGEQITRRVQTGFDAETGRPIFEDQPLNLTPLPYIVIVVDEMADLMLVAGKEIEAAVQRLAQMARAAGLHLIMATQRPSVDVITGTIKANFPTRVSFQVSSKIDSRTILGESGAEQLLGQGDMLYQKSGEKLRRIHGPYVSDEEVERIVEHLKAQSAPEYLDTITEGGDEGDGSGEGLDFEGGSEGDELYDQAVALILKERKASTSFVQRYFQIGYNRAARLVEKMEKEGLVSAPNRTGKREILIEDRGIE